VYNVLMRETHKITWLKYFIRFTIAYAVVFGIFSIATHFFGYEIARFLSPECTFSTDSECLLGASWIVIISWVFSWLIFIGLTSLATSLWINRKCGWKIALPSFIAILFAFYLIHGALFFWKF